MQRTKSVYWSLFVFHMYHVLKKKKDLFFNSNLEVRPPPAKYTCLFIVLTYFMILTYFSAACALKRCKLHSTWSLTNPHLSWYHTNITIMMFKRGK